MQSPQKIVPSLQIKPTQIIPQIVPQFEKKIQEPQYIVEQQIPQYIQQPQNIFPNNQFQNQFYPFTQNKNVQSKDLHKDLVKQIILQKRKRQGFEGQQQTKVTDETVNPTKKQKHFLSQTSVQILKEWFYDHLDHPYPSADQKEALSKQTGLTYLQVSNWFTNTRKRIWAPSMRLVNNSVKDSDSPTIQGNQEQNQEQNQEPEKSPLSPDTEGQIPYNGSSNSNNNF